MKQDTRVPTSIHHIGKFTVKIYDEEAYRRLKAQYCNSSEQAASQPVKLRKYQPYPQKKRMGTYNWTTPIKRGA